MKLLDYECDECDSKFTKLITSGPFADGSHEWKMKIIIFLLLVFSGSGHPFGFSDIRSRFRRFSSNRRLRTSGKNMAGFLAEHYSNSRHVSVASPQPPPHFVSDGNPFAGQLLFPLHKPSQILSSKPPVAPPSLKRLSKSLSYGERAIPRMNTNAVHISNRYLPQIVSE